MYVDKRQIKRKRQDFVQRECGGQKHGPENQRTEPLRMDTRSRVTQDNVEHRHHERELAELNKRPKHRPSEPDNGQRSELGDDERISGRDQCIDDVGVET
jgi:hypothetical protein